MYYMLPATEKGDIIVIAIVNSESLQLQDSRYFAVC